MRTAAVLRYVEARHPHRLNDGTRETLTALLRPPVRTGTTTALQCAGVSEGTAAWRCRKKRLPPPSAWRRLGRALRIAEELRRAPDAPLATIAASCGYRDHSAVHHAMRRVFGLTPSRVRTVRGQAPLVARWWERQTGRAA